MNRKPLYFLAFFLLVLTVFSPKAYSDAEEEVHNKYVVRAYTEIEVENFNGKVNISSWNNDYVDVHALKRTEMDQDELDLVRIEVTNDGVMEIKTVNGMNDTFFKRVFNYGISKIETFYTTNFPEKNTYFDRIFRTIHQASPKVTVDYTLKIPKSITFITIKTFDGDVELKGTQANLNIRTVNGLIFVDSPKGRIKAKTSNGNISISGGALLRDAETTNGNIKAELSGKLIDNTFISTTNGSIDLYLSPDMNAEIEMKTVNGKISATDIHLDLETLFSKHIIGTVGSGEKRIFVSTVNGNISLNREYQ